MKTITLALLATTAVAQGGPWDPLGGGTHSGWDYTPPANEVIGGVHANQNVFVILDGQTISTGGGVPVFVDALNIVIDGNLNAVDQPITLGSDDVGGSIMAGGAGTLVTLIGPRQDTFGPSLSTFDWNDVSPPGALYDIQISLNGAWGPPPVGTVNPPLHGNTAFGLPTLPTSYVAPIPFPEEVTVFWRVRISPAGPWSETWGFRVDNTPPPVPVLIAPSEGSTAGTTPTFDWTDVIDFSGVTYTLVVDNDCSFGSPDVTVVGLAISDFTPATTLPPGEYCWRITAVDGAGNMSVSATARFRVGTAMEDGSKGGSGGCSFLFFAAPASTPAWAVMAALTALGLALRRR